MEPFQIENNKELRQELERLGFINIDDMLETAAPLYAVNQAEPSGIRLTNRSENVLTNHTQFRIELNKEVGRPGWSIQHINASIEVNTVDDSRNPLTVSRSWWHSDGDMPHKERMNSLVLRKARIVAKKEYIRVEPEVTQSTLSDTARPDQLLSPELISELKKLGFLVDLQKPLKPSYLDDLVFYHIRESTLNFPTPESNSLDFLIAVWFPDKNMPLRIEYVNAGVSQGGQGYRTKQLIDDRDFWLYQAPIPTKEEMIAVLRQKFEPGIKRSATLPATNSKILNKPPGRRLGH